MSREELEKEVEVCMHNALFWLKLPISKENVEKGSSYIFELLEPREKRIAELEGKISILLSCNSCPDNKGGLLCQKEYEDKCLAQKIQYIKELKEENRQHKQLIEDLNNSKKRIAELEAQIEKMKCCQNCKFEDKDCIEEPCSVCTRCLGNIKRKGNSDKWEVKEND